APYFLKGVARAAVLLEEREPLLVQHVGVDVDDRCRIHEIPYWRSMPRVSTTRCQRAISRSTRARIASGVLWAGTPPKPAKRSLTSFSARIAPSSRFRPSMVARGVPGETATP